MQVRTCRSLWRQTLYTFSTTLATSFAGLINVAMLIGCDIGELKLALSTRKMRVGNDTIVQKLTLLQVKMLCSFVK